MYARRVEGNNLSRVASVLEQRQGLGKTNISFSYEVTAELPEVSPAILPS